MTIKPAAKQLVFLFPYAPTAWDALRFGFTYLQELGISVQVLDLSALICTRKQQRDKLIEDYIKPIHSYAELELLIAQTDHDAIYVDNINGLNGFKWQGRQIFRLLKQYQANYVIVEIGSLPLIATHSNHIISKLKKALNLKKLCTYVSWKLGKMIFNWQLKYFATYQLPQKIFVGNTDLLDYYLQRYQLPKTTIIPIHSFDYDRYLRFKRENLHPCNPKPICVFLDQALTHHSDFGAGLSFSPVTAANYLPSMNAFFNTIEQETGLKIVIAASPKANLTLTQKHYGNREVIAGKTLELVAQSELVVMHSSTAVSFPILFNKPIMMVKTHEMERAAGYGNFLTNMALALGIQPICIDRNKEVEKIRLGDYAKWKRNYDAYKFKYIVTEGLADKTTWEIVAENLGMHAKTRC